MSQDFNFDNILNKRIEEITRIPLPPGSYSAELVSVAPDKSKNKGTPLIRMIFSLTGALDDVDQELLTKAGGLGAEGKPRQVRKEFYWIADQEAFGSNFDRVLRSAGLDKTTTLGQILAEGMLNGRSCVLTIVNSMRQNQTTGEDEAQMEISGVNFAI